MEPDNLELLSDEALAQRARDGCGGSLQLLLERMAPVAVRAAAGILGRRDEACDVAQETLLKIVCEIGGYRAHGSVRGWVGVAVMGALVDERMVTHCKKLHAPICNQRWHADRLDLSVFPDKPKRHNGEKIRDPARLQRPL